MTSPMVKMIYTPRLIQPAVLAAQAHAVKEQTVEHLGLCENASEPLLREQHLGNAVEGELFRFRAVKIVIQLLQIKFGRYFLNGLTMDITTLMM